MRERKGKIECPKEYIKVGKIWFREIDDNSTIVLEVGDHDFYGDTIACIFLNEKKKIVAYRWFRGDSGDLGESVVYFKYNKIFEVKRSMKVYYDKIKEIFPDIDKEDMELVSEILRVKEGL